MVSPLVSGAIDEAQNQVQSFLAAGSDSRCLMFVAHGAIESFRKVIVCSLLRGGLFFGCLLLPGAGQLLYLLSGLGKP